MRATSKAAGTQQVGNLSAFATKDHSMNSKGSSSGLDYDLLKVPPFHYMHMLNLNTNVIRVIEGPCRYTRLDHEKIILGPEPMIIVPPRHFCVVDNPVVRNAKGELVYDKHEQVKLRHGEQEIRTSQDPFPLFPGERLNGNVQPLLVVAADTALRLRALCDFVSNPAVDNGLDRVDPDQKEKEKETEGADGQADGKILRIAGEEWLLPGPCTYVPRIEVEVRDVVHAIVVKPDQAIHLRATTDFVDSEGKKRKAGEEWLMRRTGSFLPGVNEKVITTVSAFVLTEGKALHLRATTSFTDIYGTPRKAGEEWLVEHKDTQTHIPDVYEEVVGVENIITLTKRQYCIINNPVEDGAPQLGKRQLVKGPKNFFLQPGEVLEGNQIREIIVLMAEQALNVRATEEFDDKQPVLGRPGISTTRRRYPGDKWMICGPREYIPPLEVEILSRQTALIQLEGLNLYIFNLGPVVAVLMAVMFLLYLFFFAFRRAGDKEEL